MTPKEILESILKNEDVNYAQLAKNMGLSRVQPLYDIRDGKVKRITENYASKIITAYPKYNRVWLLTGEGEMLKNKKSEEYSDTSRKEVNDTIETKTEEVATWVLLLPVSAQGGSLNDFIVSVKESDCEKVVSPIRGVDFAMTVSGDSMSPEYPNGSRVFIKRINEKAFIEWGKVYVLDTCNGTVIKILVPSEKDGHVKCISINTDPIFAPFDVSLDDIYGIYKVLLCMSVK